jgi:hypothetical protein
MDHIVEIKERKSKLVDTLIYTIETTKDKKILKDSILLLIDNFKDDRIIPLLKKLIKSPEMVGYNAFLVYALGSYIEYSIDFMFFVDLIISEDYHVAFNAYNIIANYFNDIDNELIEQIVIKLKLNYSTQVEKKEFFDNMLNFFD